MAGEMDVDRSTGGMEPVEVTEGRIAAGRAAGIEGVGAAQADTARSIRAERTESPGSSGIVGLSLESVADSGFCSPSSFRAALFRLITELSCIFHVHSAWISRPAEVNIATMRQGSSPRRVDFQVTDSMPIPAEASVRSTSSLMVRTLLSLGAATARNCSMAYCFSVSTAMEKRRTSISLR